MKSKTLHTNIIKRITSCLPLILGLVCLVGAFIILLTGQDDETLKVTHLVFYVMRPRFVPFPWRMLVVSILLPMSFLVSIPTQAVKNLWRIVAFVWLIVYFLYMWMLYEAEHMMLLQGFDFRQFTNWPYLFLISVYLGFSLRLQLIPTLQADIYSFLVGVIVTSLATSITTYQGPKGAQIGSFAQSLSFVLFIPAYLLTGTSLISLSVNTIRWVWWEIAGKTLQLGQ